MIAHLRSLTSTDVLTDSTSGLVQSSSQPKYSFLTNSASAQAYNISTAPSRHQLITTHTTFALSQLPALRAVLADLRPRLAALPGVQLSSGSAKDERRDERREYIEQGTKTQLDRNGYAAPGVIRAGTGRRVEQEEVKALETVSSMFGGS